MDCSQLAQKKYSPTPFTIRVSLFPNVFYQLAPQLYKIKYKPKILPDMKEQILPVLKSEDK